MIPFECYTRKQSQFTLITQRTGIKYKCEYKCHTRFNRVTCSKVKWVKWLKVSEVMFGYVKGEKNDYLERVQSQAPIRLVVPSSAV